MKIKNKYTTPFMFLVIFFTMAFIYQLVTNDGMPKAEATPLERLYKLPVFSKISDVKEKKETFFSTLYPIIQEENMHVLKLRKQINILKIIPAQDLTESQQAWLLKISTHYRLKNEVIDNSIFEQLLRRVDYIPPSLALAQAAIESGWGSSRFSRKGNNLFGQWCFSKGCGMVPSSRDSDKGHEVAQFETVNKSVRSYIRNLNTHHSYTELRKKRALLREKNDALTGIALAKTLLKYSEEGKHYVSKLTKFINQNKLYRFNVEFERSLLIEH